MNGLDFEAAGAIQHLCEEPAGTFAHPLAAILTERIEVCRQFDVLEPDPGGQPRADAVRHFRRGRLCKCQAEDRFRPRAL